MWFRQDKRPPQGVQLGESFRRSRGAGITETAKIVAVAADSLGILHVRFKLKISDHRAADEEHRTLALESFRSLYPEPVAVRG